MTGKSHFDDFYECYELKTRIHNCRVEDIRGNKLVNKYNDMFGGRYQSVIGDYDFEFSKKASHEDRCDSMRLHAELRKNENDYLEMMTSDDTVKKDSPLTEYIKISNLRDEMINIQNDYENKKAREACFRQEHPTWYDVAVARAELKFRFGKYWKGIKQVLDNNNFIDYFSGTYFTVESDEIYKKIDPSKIFLSYDDVVQIARYLITKHNFETRR